MTSFSDPIKILNTKGPATGQSIFADPAGISAGFRDVPKSFEHQLNYRWPDMMMEVHARNSAASGEVEAVRAQVRVGLDSWNPITPQILGERIAELVNSLAQRSGSLSGTLNVMSYGNCPAVVTEGVLARFDQVRK